MHHPAELALHQYLENATTGKSSIECSELVKVNNAKVKSKKVK